MTSYGDLIRANNFSDQHIITCLMHYLPKFPLPMNHGFLPYNAIAIYSYSQIYQCIQCSDHPILTTTHLPCCQVSAMFASLPVCRHSALPRPRLMSRTLAPANGLQTPGSGKPGTHCRHTAEWGKCHEQHEVRILWWIWTRQSILGSDWDKNRIWMAKLRSWPYD